MLGHIEYMRKRMKEEQANMQSDNIEMSNMVDHPPHYNTASIETIDIIGSVTGDGFEFYLQGNIMKYLCRYPYKNGVEDLEKARWYLNKLIEIKMAQEVNFSFTPNPFLHFQKSIVQESYLLQHLISFYNLS